MFKSFFIAGFECATGINREGEWIDLVSATWHDVHADEDYQRLQKVGILAARDAIRWPLVDLGNGRYDFSTVAPLVTASRRYGIDVIWDLFHYGYPADVDLLSEAFIPRFADYCAACARYLRQRLDGTLWFTPVNEPSFFAWAAGQDAQFAPHLKTHKHELKVALVRAALRGIEAIRAEAPDARFLHADPLCRVVPPDDTPEAREAARDFNEREVFEAWDMICGKRMPELGGSRAHLDVVGLNYSWTCQWVNGQDGRYLPDDDCRRVPFAYLAMKAWERYGGDIVIAETMHWGEHRAEWFKKLLDDIRQVFDAGVPLKGVCLFPILNMQDWHAPRDWIPMGLWDIDRVRGGCRIPHQPLVDAVINAQRMLARKRNGGTPKFSCLPSSLGIER